jgi:hypothetical protein
MSREPVGVIPSRFYFDEYTPDAASSQLRSPEGQVMFCAFTLIHMKKDLAPTAGVALLGQQVAGAVPVGTLVASIEEHSSCCRAEALKEFP